MKLTNQEVLNHALLEEHLPLEADGYSCTTDDLLASHALLGVAANQGTIESVCTDLVGAPDADTIRGYFNPQLCVEDLPDLAARLNAALATEVPDRVRRRARRSNVGWIVAIDLNARPYSGKQPQAEGLWMCAARRPSQHVHKGRPHGRLGHRQPNPARRRRSHCGRERPRGQSLQRVDELPGQQHPPRPGHHRLDPTRRPAEGSADYIGRQALRRCVGVGVGVGVWVWVYGCVSLTRPFGQAPPFSAEWCWTPLLQR
jgi:hypothetical protein